jgi:hypothetical protein
MGFGFVAASVTPAAMVDNIASFPALHQPYRPIEIGSDLTEGTFGANLNSRDRGLSGLGECSIHREIPTISRQSANKVMAGTSGKAFGAGHGMSARAQIPAQRASVATGVEPLTLLRSCHKPLLSVSITADIRRFQGLAT